VREHPIIFSGPMVRAILDGRKTQTRRVVKPQPAQDPWFDGEHKLPTLKRHYTRDQTGGHYAVASPGVAKCCPYGAPGDRLWVRETFYHDPEDAETPLYRADGDLDFDRFDAGCKWQPSIFMPRTLSRITLEITNVRVERLWSISDQDAIAEGLDEVACPVANTKLWRNYDPSNGWSKGLSPMSSYRSLWESINAKRAPWLSNPWVWVLTFERVDAAQERQAA
jgi:hypothetical protein